MAGDGDAFNDTVCTAIQALPTGLEQIESKSILNVFPNPGKGKFYLEAGMLNSEMSLVITDILGREIWKKTSFGNSLETIDLTSQPGGIYVLTLRTPGFSLSKKMVICK
jgi:hypothetical protein